MKITLVPPHASPAITAMLDYYQSTDLDQGEGSFEQYLNEAKKFLESVKSRIEEFKDFEIFYDQDRFIFPNDWSDNAKFDFILGFINFCKIVWQLTNNYTPVPSECKGVTRKALPTLADFESSEWKISRKLPDYTLAYGK